MIGIVLPPSFNGYANIVSVCSVVFSNSRKLLIMICIQLNMHLSDIWYINRNWGCKDTQILKRYNLIRFLPCNHSIYVILWYLNDDRLEPKRIKTKSWEMAADILLNEWRPLKQFSLLFKTHETKKFANICQLLRSFYEIVANFIAFTSKFHINGNYWEGAVESCWKR